MKKSELLERIENLEKELKELKLGDKVNSENIDRSLSGCGSGSKITEEQQIEQVQDDLIKLLNDELIEHYIMGIEQDYNFLDGRLRDKVIHVFLKSK